MLRRPRRAAARDPVAALAILVSAVGPALAGQSLALLADPVARLDGIAPALARCWRPPHEGDEATMKLSFRRDGSEIGRPRFTFLIAAGGRDGEAALANSLLDAVRACLPLRFTPSMGGAIAGRVLLIRLVAPRRERRARQDGSSGDRA